MGPLILAALVIAGVIVGVDAIRQRRARRDALDVRAVVAAAIGRPSSAPAVASLLDARVGSRADDGSIAHGDQDSAGLWDDLDTLLDPESFVPLLAEDTEIKSFEMRWGNDYAIVARPDHALHYEVQPWEAALMQRMDGTNSAGALIVERMQEAGDLDPGAVLALIRSLHEDGFLDPAPPNVGDIVRDHLDRASSARRKLREFTRSLRLSWDGAEGFVRWAHRAGGKRFFGRPVVITGAIVAIAGLACFVDVQRSGRFALSSTQAPGETILFLALALFLTFAHELGHAMALVHYRRRVLGAGFFIFFGSPAFYVDASDGLLLERHQRIVQSFAGPYAELVLAGIASIVMFAFPDTGTAAFLYRFALINYFVIFMNLIPLLELDGYWIFADLIQVPDLRRRSLNFLKGDLWHKIGARERFSLQETGFAFYGIVGTAFTIFSFYTAFFFWREIFGGLITSLWEGGLVSRILLILLAFAFLGPMIRGAITLLRTIWRQVSTIVERVRFRFERSWRVEAAALIDALPAFNDLDEALLSDLAGRVEVVSVGDGQTVFRRGDQADAFYVVRSGAIRIEDEQPDSGDTVVLTTLGRGDAFGELGLLGSAPRAATARADGRTTLFRIDKAAFDRLLADDITAPTFAPTMQAYAELRSLPVFRTLSTADLASVLSHGSWRTAAPGEVLIREGDPGDAFYALGAGRVDVIRGGEVVAALGPGEHFGDVALLTDAPRNATVVTHTPSRIFRLDREGFQRVVAETLRRGPVERAPERNMEH